jgi:hypothetical protein
MRESIQYHRISLKVKFFLFPNTVVLSLSCLIGGVECNNENNPVPTGTVLPIIIHSETPVISSLIE